MDMIIGSIAYFLYLSQEIGIDLLTLVSVLFAINAFFFHQGATEKNKHEKQLNYLNSISARIELLKTKSQGFKDELEGKNVSAYDLDEVNPEFYLQNMDYRIRNRKTKPLLKLLSQINDKITLLNGYNKEVKKILQNPLIQVSDKYGNYSQIYVDASKKIIDTKLKELIENIEEEIKNFEKPENKNSIRFWFTWLMAFVAGITSGTVVLYVSDITERCSGILDCPLDYLFLLIFMLIGFFAVGYMVKLFWIREK